MGRTSAYGEIICLVVNDIDPALANATSAFKDFFEQTRANPAFRSLNWGPTEERDGGFNLLILIEWNDETSTAPCRALLPLVDNSKPSQCIRSHVLLQDPDREFQDAAASGNISSVTGISPYVTECVFLGYPWPSAVQAQHEHLVHLFEGLHALPAEQDGAPLRARSFAAGWFLDPWTTSDGGDKTNIIFGLVHWDSVETHMRARDTTTFKERILPLREKVVATPWKLRHVRFRAPDASNV